MSGIPADLKALRPVCTALGVLFKVGEALAPAGGKLALELPARSLTTLTTLPVAELKEP